MSDLNTFRQETRAWLNENCPASCQGDNNILPDILWGGRRQKIAEPDVQLWMDRLVAQGWTIPGWPKEYGGGGLSADESKVLAEEMSAIGTHSPLYSFGISMLGPALLEYATEEQKREHLPRIASGEIRWCQGYSEPGSGSDLASLQCKAVKDGDDYVVTGQKVWTSTADVSDWIFCLVRTDSDAPKHEGISFLLIDMESEGVSARPIVLLSGASPFCETFFDGVRVPIANRVHEENKGWSVAKALLLHERTMLAGGPGRASTGNQKRTLLEVARDSMNAPTGPLPDKAVRAEIAQTEMDQMCYAATLQKVQDAAKAGKGMGPEGSMFKLYLSELGQRSADLRQRLNGADGLIWDGDEFHPEAKESTREWLYSRASTILGGTSEIQLNIITKRVLGLPE
ncbi:MAG: acyl-CoA dehydrogenase family protein [Pseudomonadales bacterium]|nr:acyl-CoA dehydrogenase family protein [Pseudomonadales bacterium]